MTSVEPPDKRDAVLATALAHLEAAMGQLSMVQDALFVLTGGGDLPAPHVRRTYPGDDPPPALSFGPQNET
jgi:hypothetical protein